MVDAAAERRAAVAVRCNVTSFTNIEVTTFPRTTHRASGMRDVYMNSLVGALAIGNVTILKRKPLGRSYRVAYALSFDSHQCYATVAAAWYSP
ncbi:unnamed protein product [Colias eurytheme]|nr:unnamed protein product [Colias eurytheme]